MAKTMRLASIVLLVAGATCSSGGGLPNGWKPSWKVGDWWRVKSRSTMTIYPGRDTQLVMSEMPIFSVEYRVVAEESVEGRACFVVEQRPLPVSPHFENVWRYYYDQENLRILRTVSDVASPKAGTERLVRDYHYDYAVPFMDNNNRLGEVPAFPLAFSGSDAESLKARRVDPTRHSVSQTVSPGDIAGFSGVSLLADTVSDSPRNCYSVILRTWRADTILDTETRQAWIPGLPWFLFSEKQYVVNGKPSVMVVCWLADCSARHEHK